MISQLQIPVTIPQGVSSTNINKITEQLAIYAQFLLSHVQNAKEEQTTSMSLDEAQRYLDSLSIKGEGVPKDVNGMRDIVNTKYM